MTSATTAAAPERPKNAPAQAPSLLGQLVAAIASRKIRVVDLTQTLSPDFPQIALPPEMGQCWPFRIEEVSSYDARGPGWYWNNFSCGEHTGTHFDAPIHWISGRDLPNNAVDTIPTQHFVAPACVIDCSAEAAADARYYVGEGVARLDAYHASTEAICILERDGRLRELSEASEFTAGSLAAAVEKPYVCLPKEVSGGPGDR